MGPAWIEVNWTGEETVTVVISWVKLAVGVRFLNTVTHDERFSHEVVTYHVPAESVAEWLMLYWVYGSAGFGKVWVGFCRFDGDGSLKIQ
jgi:hypothetical protein